MKKQRKTVAFQMRVTPDFIKRLDRWRGKQNPIPSRTKVVRTLVEAAISPKKTCG